MKTKIIIALAILLLFAVGYIAIDKYKEKTQIAFASGYNEAIKQVGAAASSCQQIPIQYENKAVNIIAVECLGK